MQKRSSNWSSASACRLRHVRQCSCPSQSFLCKGSAVLQDLICSVVDFVHQPFLSKSWFRQSCRTCACSVVASVHQPFLSKWWFRQSCRTWQQCCCFCPPALPQQVMVSAVLQDLICSVVASVHQSFSASDGFGNCAIGPEVTLCG